MIHTHDPWGEYRQSRPITQPRPLVICGLNCDLTQPGCEVATNRRGHDELVACMRVRLWDAIDEFAGFRWLLACEHPARLARQFPCRWNPVSSRLPENLDLGVLVPDCRDVKQCWSELDAMRRVYRPTAVALILRPNVRFSLDDCSPDYVVRYDDSGDLEVETFT